MSDDRRLRAVALLAEFRERFGPNALLGEGSWRVVYDSQDGYVLKVPCPYRNLFGECMAENRLEVRLFEKNFSYRFRDRGAEERWGLFKKWFEVLGEPLPLATSELKVMNKVPVVRMEKVERLGLEEYEKLARWIWSLNDPFSVVSEMIKGKRVSGMEWIALADGLQIGRNKEGRIVLYDYNYWRCSF